MKHVEDNYCTCDGAGRCNGCNLFICKVCGGAESSLPKDCPGTKMTYIQSEAISAGTLDYVKGKWIREVEHVLTPCCNCGDSCQSNTVACNFTRCTVCGVEDSTKEGEEELEDSCKGKRICFNHESKESK